MVPRSFGAGEMKSGDTGGDRDGPDCSGHLKDSNLIKMEDQDCGPGGTIMTLDPVESRQFS